MDKKILSVAIAGALAGSMAFAANADVTLYGQVDLSIDSMDVDGGEDDINMNSNTSAIGVKGSEDLGNGLKAIFLLEYQTDASGTTSAQGLNGGRDQWIGLQGGFGKIRFGTMSTTYKASGAMVDPFYRTSFEGRAWGLQSALHSGSGENGQGRATNTIGYDTPDFNGFSAAATYSFDDDCRINANALAGTTTCGGADDDSYSVGARYKNGPALVFADYITNGAGGSDDAWKIGGKFSFGAAAVYGQYEMDGGLISSVNNGTLNVQNTAEEDGDVWHLGASYTMGNAMVYAAYGQGDDTNDPTYNAEYDVWTIAGQYSFSKRTMVYAGFQQVDFDEAGVGERDHFGLGMRHKF